jgi:GNAT superfamily N-acetyltransferase
VPVQYRVESASERDLGELAALRLAQGWHANRALLAALLGWERARVFVVREGAAGEGEDGGVIATTAAIACDEVGIIGNVIVRGDRQRRGLGRLVMERTIAWLGERGVRSVLLDATVEGRPLYRKLGFVERGISWFADGTLAGIRRTALGDRAGELRASLRGAGEMARLAALDAAAFGGDRMGLVVRMLGQPGTGLYVAEDGRGDPLGYALMRPLAGANVGAQIGPWVARDERAAAALLRAAIGADAPWRAAMGSVSEEDITLHVGMSGMHAGAMELCETLGLRLVEDDALMQLDLGADGGYGGEPKPVGALRRTAEHPEWVYGWLAPMVF